MPLNRVFILIVCAVIGFVSVPLWAGPIEFTINGTQMSYSSSTTSWTIADTSLSNVVGKYDAQSATIAGGSNFDFSVSNLSFSVSGTSWSTSGDVTLTDISGTRLQGTFTSTSVDLFTNPVGLNTFSMTGGLFNSGSSLLVGGTPSWVFAGDSSTSISITNLSTWTSGDAVTFNWFTNVTSLDTFFSTMPTLTGGTAVLSVVPLPAAVFVGLFGMGVTALKLRKYV